MSDSLYTAVSSVTGFQQLVNTPVHVGTDYVAISGTIISEDTPRWNRTALSVESNVVPVTGSWNSTNTTLVANSSQWAEAKADIAEVAAASANWTTGYNNSLLSRADLAGVAGVSANWTTGYNNSLLSRADLAGVAGVSANWTTGYNNSLLGRADLAGVAAVSANWTTGYNNSLLSRADLAGVAVLSANWTSAYNAGVLSRADLAGVAGVSANWTTAYTRSDGVVTIHSDVSNAGSGAIITTDERDKFTRAWTNVSSNSASYSSSFNSSEIAAASARYTRTALSLETNVAPATGSWNSTNTTLVANSSQWAEAKADIAEVAAASANWTSGYNASVLSRADLAGVAGVSANWTTAYTRSDGVVTIHSDVSNAGSGAIITTDERDKFTRAWTNVSGNSASYSSSFNSSAIAAASARWNTNATTEVAAASGRWNRTALSLETNVVPSTGSWNSTTTTVNVNSADWSYVAANSAGGTAPGRLSVDSEAIYTTVSTDASYFDVMALLHFEDANAATSTSDDSFSRRAVSFAGTAQISTAQKKFGTASLLLDGNSDYVSLANSADLDLGTSPFTIECWFYYNAATAPEYATIFDRGDGSGGGTSPFWLAIKDDSGTYRLVGAADATGGSGNDIFENYEAATISNNTWYHLAFVRDGNNFYTYLNGTVAWALTGSTSSAMADNNEPLYIGARGQSGTGAYWGGYIDEFRLTVGTCRYAGGITFTPSTDGLPGETRFNQTVITGISASTGMTSFQLEDDDGTEVAVSDAKEVKFIGSGITTNWTDTSTGSDGDPYDLTFTVDQIQSNIVTLTATDLKIGEDDQTKIDFETANEIHFYANNTEQVYLADNIFGPQSDSDVDLGTTGVRWKDAYIDTITTTGDVTLGGSVSVTEAAIANGDYILFLDGGSTGDAKKEAFADVATLLGGDGLNATNSVLKMDIVGLTDLTNSTFGTANYGVGDQLAVTDSSASSATKRVKFPVEIGVACSDETSDLTTGTAKVTFHMPHAMTLTEVRANVNTAGAGVDPITVDINEGGSTILSTKLTFDTGEKTTTSAATPAVISDTALADDAIITIDIDQVQNVTAGKGLKVWLIGYR